MHQQLWGYKVEEKLYLGVREQKELNTAVTMEMYHQKASLSKNQHEKHKDECYGDWFRRCSVDGTG
jgi:hypothetical protein